MKKICLILPFPPPYYGPSVYSGYFLKALNKIDGLDVVKINSEINKSASQIGIKPLKKVIKYFFVIIKIPFFTYKSHTITNLNLFYSGILKTFFIVVASKIFSKSITLLLHEGGLNEILSNSSKLHKKLIDLSVGYSDLIIALDPIQKNEWKNIYKDSNIQVLPAYREASLSNLRQNQVIFFSNLIPDKGIFDAVEIWKKFQEISNIDAVLYIIGTSVNPQIDEELKTKTKNVKNIKLKINLSRKEAINLLSKSKLFIMPTTYFLEQQPAVIIEALSHSLPLVTYNWRGLPFMVEDELNGFCVNVKNYDQFALRISQILEDNELHSKLSLHSNYLFLKNHSEEAFVKNLKVIISKNLI